MGDRKHDNFDEFAQDYDDVHAKTLNISGADRNYFSEYKIAEIARHELSSSPISVLDFGCGDGNSVKYMEEYFPSALLYGTDVSSLSINEAREKNIRNARFFNYNGISLPFEEESFDVVFTSMVFHHINFSLHKKVLSEIFRVLKPGGRFYIFEHNPLNPMTQKIVRECAFDHDAVLLPHRYTEKLLVDRGFRLAEVRFTLFFPRHGVFRWLFPTERYLEKFPFGAQYYFRSVKPSVI